MCSASIYRPLSYPLISLTNETCNNCRWSGGYERATARQFTTLESRIMESWQVFQRRICPPVLIHSRRWQGGLELRYRYPIFFLYDLSILAATTLASRGSVDRRGPVWSIPKIENLIGLVVIEILSIRQKKFLLYNRLSNNSSIKLFSSIFFPDTNYLLRNKSNCILTC